MTVTPTTSCRTRTRSSAAAAISDSDLRSDFRGRGRLQRRVRWASLLQASDLRSAWRRRPARGFCRAELDTFRTVLGPAASSRVLLQRAKKPHLVQPQLSSKKDPVDPRLALQRWSFGALLQLTSG